MLSEALLTEGGGDDLVAGESLAAVQQVQQTVRCDEEDKCWELVCRVFFWQDEKRFHAQVFADVAESGGMSSLPSVSSVAQVLNSLQNVSATLDPQQQQQQQQGEEESCRLPEEPLVAIPRSGLSPGAERLFEQLGFVVDQASGVWTSSRDAVLTLEAKKKIHRSAFHSRVAKLRYEWFLCEVTKVFDESRTELRSVQIDPEQPGEYSETPEMASRQRESIARFVQRFASDSSAAPILNSLCKLLREQVGSDQVYCWALDDESLVERGHALAQALVRLLLLDLRCDMPNLDRENTRVSRLFVLDRQLSDMRLERLLALFPASCKQARVNVSGTLSPAPSELGLSRTNHAGEKDASCPQDSPFYPLLSRCDIL